MVWLPLYSVQQKCHNPSVFFMTSILSAQHYQDMSLLQCICRWILVKKTGTTYHLPRKLSYTLYLFLYFCRQILDHMQLCGHTSTHVNTHIHLLIELIAWQDLAVCFLSEFLFSLASGKVKIYMLVRVLFRVMWKWSPPHTLITRNQIGSWRLSGHTLWIGLKNWNNFSSHFHLKACETIAGQSLKI